MPKKTQTIEEYVEQLQRECHYEGTKTDYEACCANPESECTVETQPDFDAIAARNIARQKQTYIEYSVIIVLIIIIISALYLFNKKGYYKKYIHPHLHKIKMVVSGWLIWALCIYSYNQLFDEYLNYATWLTLPVICASAIYLWVNKFVSK